MRTKITEAVFRKALDDEAEARAKRSAEVANALVREVDVQRQVTELLHSVGAFVARTNQNRASRVSPGLPDVIALLPRRLGVLFVEVKAAKGKQSDAQILFQARCEQAGEPYILGGVAEVTAYLESVGILL